MSKTLVKLKVSDTSGFTNVGDVSLPKLKTLDLDGVKFNENGAAFTKLVSGCPALEELVMGNVCFSCEFLLVSNQTLKRLEVCFNYTDGKPESVSFDTPNLVYLKFDGIAAAVKYPKVNFDSLVEAKIDLEIAHRQDEESANATDLFMGICNVEILYLSRYSLEVLAFSCRAIPVFNNLNHLTVDSDEEVQWKSLPKLLKKCPNLETLVFKGLHQKDRTNDRKPWKVTRRCLSSSPVKMLKVLKFGEFCSYVGDDMYKQKEMIKYFLETMPNLEQATIYYDETSIDDDDASILLTEFQMLESVASRKCKIQVIPDNISFAPWPMF